MAHIQLKICSLKKEDIIAEYFELSRDAAKYREREMRAAIKIQTKWKGHNTRVFFQELESVTGLIQRVFRGFLGRKRHRLNCEKINQQIRAKYYNQNAIKIQRLWRGHYSRQTKFDYYGRKKYLKDLEEKMEAMRASLAQHSLDQREAEVLNKQARQADLISKLAGKRHHLLGTLSNPGVYALPPRSQRPPTEQAIALQHTILKIPESQIRSNEVIKQWIADNIKNSKRFIQNHSHQTHDLAENNEKLVQGPFLPKHYLYKKIHLPFKPTLRVQTNYYDTQDYKREEKRREILQRCSDKYFSTARIRHTPKDYFLKAEPYQIPKYGRLYFRESDSEKNVSKKLILGHNDIFEETAW